MAGGHRPAGPLTRDRLREQAERSRAAAADLEAVAGEVEHRLDGVLDDLGSPVWLGHAAEVARDAAEDARWDLAVAARSLRDTAQELRVEAAALAWRADRVLPAGPGIAVGVGDDGAAR